MQNLGLLVYDRRTQHPPQFTPIQDGAGQDQDGLRSMLSVNDARNPDDIASSVYMQQMPDGQSPTTQGGYNHQDRCCQISQRIVQPASTSSSMHIDYRSHEVSQQAMGNYQPFMVNSLSQQAMGNHQPIVDNSSSQQAMGNHQPIVDNSSSQQAMGNHQPFVGNSSTYAQSVSGFSSYGMNIPSGGHLQLLPDSFELPLNISASPSNCIVADPHVSSTHEALARGLCALIGHSTYTYHWNRCYYSAISAGHDQTTAEAFANHHLYYPDSSPVLKCLHCQNEHDDTRPFEHAKMCIVWQCLTTLTMEHDNTQVIPPRQRLAEGVNPQSRSEYIDLKENVQKGYASRPRSEEVHVRADCLNHQTPAPIDMSTLDNEYRTANLMPVAHKDHSVPREHLDQAGTIRTENTLHNSVIPAGQSQTCIDPNSTDYMTANQMTIHPLQNTAAASNVSPPQTTGRKKIQYPLYADRQTRIRSFDNWPTSSTQKPKRLAQAGFYYTGTSDHCRCFYCGGLLRNWEDDDDPMTEHKYWFPDCPFVMDAKRMDCNTMTSTDKDVTNIKERNQCTSDQTVEHGMTNLALQERDVPGSGIFQTLEDMGFSREDVILAAQSVGRRAQHAYSIEELLTALLQKQNNGTGRDAANIPPAMDVNICGVCNRNVIRVTQYHCGHIVCRKCIARRDCEGNFRCRICAMVVIKVVAIDSSAFNN